MRDGIQSLTWRHLMDTPSGAMAGRNGIKSVSHGRGRPRRHPQLISGGSHRLQHGWIEILDFRYRAVGGVRDQRQMGGSVNIDAVVADGLVQIQAFQVVILGILGHDGHGDNQRERSWRSASAVRSTGSTPRSRHSRYAGRHAPRRMVRNYRPPWPGTNRRRWRTNRADGGRRRGWLFPGPCDRPTWGLIQTVLPSSELDELPHSDGALVGLGARQEARFGLRQKDQLLRHAFVIQNALDQRLDSGRHAVARRPGSCGRDQWKNSGCSLRQRRSLRAATAKQWQRFLPSPWGGGAGRWGRSIGGCRRAEVCRRPRRAGWAGTDAFQIVAVNGFGHLIQLALQPLAIRNVLGSRQQHVHGGIEFTARTREVTLLVKLPAGFEMSFRFENPGIGFLSARRSCQNLCTRFGVSLE